MASGLLLFILYIGLTFLSSLGAQGIKLYLVFNFVLFLVYLLAIHLISRLQYHQKLLLLILVFAVLFRLPLLFSSPLLSSEVYRYIWDGKVIGQGMNPYLQTPASPKLQSLQDQNSQKIDCNKDKPSNYLPLSLYIFRAGQMIYPHPFTFKFLFVLFDLATAVMILVILRKYKLNPTRSIIYLWNPLVIVEFAWNGHLDSVGIFFLMAALFCLATSRKLTSAIFFALSSLVKFIPLVLLPKVAKEIKHQGIFAWIILMLILSLPFISAPLFHFQKTGFYNYLQESHFNGFLYTVLSFITKNDQIARLMCLGIFIAVLVYFLLRKYNIFKYSFLTIGTLLLVMPTFFPWYFIWVIPFLCFFWFPPAMLLVALLPLSYIVLLTFKTTGLWQESIYIQLIQFIPFYLYLIYYVYKSLNKERELKLAA